MSDKDDNISREEEKEESVNREHQDKNENKEEENKENEENKEEEKEEEPEEEPFSYLDNANNQILYVKEKLDDENNIIKVNLNILYVFYQIIMNLLVVIHYKKTLDSIGNNLKGLKDNLNIGVQEIVIFIFISEIKNYNNKLFTLNQEDEIEDKINENIIKEREITNINE